MSVLFTFPGQGAQRPGMLHRLPDHGETRRALDEAGQVLGRDMLALDDEASLAGTAAVQLCLLVAGVAMVRVLAAHGAAPDMVAGLSIGAYPAAVAAGVLDYADALRLVDLRGGLMQQRYPAGYGMAAIVGLERGELQPLIDAAHSPRAPVYLANLNAPRQLVVSGRAEALRAVMREALRAGASSARRLAADIPSHCPLYEDDARVLHEAVRQAAMRRPAARYLSASEARALNEPADIGRDLAFNMARQVHWHDTVRLAWELGARLALEMPPGAVLTGLTAPVFAQGRVACSENNRLETLAKLAGRERDGA